MPYFYDFSDSLTGFSTVMKEHRYQAITVLWICKGCFSKQQNSCN